MKFKRNPRLARISLLDRSWSVSSPALGRGIIIIEIGDTSKRVLNYRHDFKLFKFKLLEVHDTFCQPRQRSWGSPATADSLQKITSYSYWSRLDLGSSPVLLDSTKLLRWMPVLQNGELDWCQTWLFPFLPTYILSALLWLRKWHVTIRSLEVLRSSRLDQLLCTYDASATRIVSIDATSSISFHWTNATANELPLDRSIHLSNAT